MDRKGGERGGREGRRESEREKERIKEEEEGREGCIKLYLLQEYTRLSGTNVSESLCTIVGMVRKQDGGFNGCISNYTMITRLGASVVHFKALSVLFFFEHCPSQ